MTTAFTACEYSHSWRNSLQLFGGIVQLAVAWLAGKDQVKKMAKKTTKHRAAVAAKRKARRCRRSLLARTTFMMSAARSTMPNHAHPA